MMWTVQMKKKKHLIYSIGYFADVQKHLSVTKNINAERKMLFTRVVGFIARVLEM